MTAPGDSRGSHQQKEIAEALSVFNSADPPLITQVAFAAACVLAEAVAQSGDRTGRYVPLILTNLKIFLSDRGSSKKAGDLP